MTTTITALPTPPSRSDPVNFAARGDAFLGALPAFATEANALSVEVNADAISAASSASLAAAAATHAGSSSQIALAAANFKGLWSSLTGALNKPASVKHNGRFWLLLNNLVNVTTSVPGVTADWTSLDSGTLITAVVATNTTAVPGVCYLITNTGLTLTMPATPLKGDYVGIRYLAAPNSSSSINFNGSKLFSQTVSTDGIALLDVKSMALDLNYEDSTYGWI